MTAFIIGVILAAAGAFVFVKTLGNDDVRIKVGTFLCVCIGILLIIGGCIKDSSGTSSKEKLYNQDGADKTIMSSISIK